MYGIGLSKGIGIENIRIHGKRHTLFKTDDNRLRMVDGTCPHRGAKLADGRVKGQNIQCPYHGWEFDGDGKLKKVPSSKSLPCGADLQSYPIIEDGGFVWMSDAYDELPTRHCDELFDPSWVKVYGSKELQGNMTDWILNGTDISHINYVHNFADENNGIVTNTHVEMFDRYVDCFATVQPKASSSFTKHMQPDNGSNVRARFVGPATSIIRIRLNGPYEFITFTTLLPMDEENTKMSWCLLYPKMPLLDNPLIYTRFYNKMFETVAQDEAIIQNLEWVPLSINVKCDIFQLKALELLKNRTLLIDGEK